MGRGADELLYGEHVVKPDPDRAERDRLGSIVARLVRGLNIGIISGGDQTELAAVIGPLSEHWKRECVELYSFVSPECWRFHRLRYWDLDRAPWENEADHPGPMFVDLSGADDHPQLFPSHGAQIRERAKDSPQLVVLSDSPGAFEEASIWLPIETAVKLR